MAIRIMDSIKTANDTTDFPVSYAKDVWLNKDKSGATEDYSDLQTMYNNDELGNGGSAIQVDTMPIASEYPNEIVQYIGKSGTYQNGYFYQSTSDEQNPPTYSWVQKNVQPNSVTLTQQEYEALSEEQKLDGLYYTYDTKRIYKNGVQYGASDAEGIGYNNAESGIQATTVQGAIDKVVEKVDGLISDTTSSTTSTWSSQKTSSKIAEKIDKTNILTALDDAATDDQVYSAKAINAELDGVVKKTDISTTINSTSTDDTVPSAKAVWDKSKNKIQPLLNGVDIIVYADSISNEIVTDTVRIMSATNSPYGVDNVNNDFYYTIYNINDDKFKRILAYDIRKNDMYMIMKKDGVWGTWQRVCTTKVANVPFTKLTLDSSVFTLVNSDAALGYSVCNGMCIIICSGIGLVSVGSYIAATNIPKPVGGYASNILQPGAGSSVPTTPVFLVASNNTLTILSSTHTGPFWGTLTYPVAE